ncbi:hypothetical protein [Portibacter lacus]|uniref:hypothetical protein n=1 Tax=Portibacter lacus TaxID=1099794 RepID=UPI001F41692F|nr:hypothetical protein [Portibacter lacus]
MPLPPQSSTYTGQTRGYWFTAPSDFEITSIGVPTDASTDNQSVAIITLNVPPPDFSLSTLDYTVEFLAQDVPGVAPISVNVPITAGTMVGILGSRGANSINSYGTPSPYNTTLLGNPVSLSRLLMQNDLQTVFPFAVSGEPGPFDFGRVNITVASLNSVPTLSEWSLIICGLIMLSIGVVVLKQRYRSTKLA